MSRKRKLSTGEQTRVVLRLKRTSDQPATRMTPPDSHEKYLPEMDPNANAGKPKNKRQTGGESGGKGGVVAGNGERVGDDEGKTLQLGESSDDESLPDAFAILSRGRDSVKVEPTMATFGGPTTSGNLPPRSSENTRKRSQSVISISTSEVESESELSEAEEGPEELKNVSPQNLGVQKGKGNATQNAVRDAFYAFGGWHKADDVLPTRRNQDGQPLFWTTDESGQKLKPTPAWDLEFEENWREWGSEFLKVFRREVKKPGYATWLVKADNTALQRCLKASVWNECKFSAKLKSIGVVEGNHKQTSLQIGQKAEPDSTISVQDDHQIVREHKNHLPIHPEPRPSGSDPGGLVVPASSQLTIPATSNNSLSLPAMQAFLLIPSEMSVQYGASGPQLTQNNVHTSHPVPTSATVFHPGVGLYQLVQQGQSVQLVQTSTPPVQPNQSAGPARPPAASQPSEGPSNSTSLAPLTLYPVTLGSFQQGALAKPQPTHEAREDQSQATVTSTPGRVSRRMKGKTKA